MNMQQMLMQAQKMQKELKKAQDALNAKEFTLSKAGVVTVTMLGSYEIKSIKIDKDACNPEDVETVEDMTVSAINELLNQISEEKEQIEEQITGRKGGLGF